jgi:vacuolar-type H+-ATPase subunit E/Vma4
MIQQSILSESKKTATIEKNKLIYLTKGENKEKLIKTKEAIFSSAFGEADERLSNVRKDQKYPEILKNLTREAVGALGGETFRIHIDKRDENQIKKILSELNLSGEVIDLQSSGSCCHTQNEDVKFQIPLNHVWIG